MPINYPLALATMIGMFSQPLSAQAIYSWPIFHTLILAGEELVALQFNLRLDILIISQEHQMILSQA
jgi:hypothetical protein